MSANNVRITAVYEMRIKVLVQDPPSFFAIDYYKANFP